ncbi:MAG: cyclic nucleotide-binding domain-containing protein [Deltaproteobacteria bacterium]|nr:cyclic nucleotide-binding domain-containing protein [Deltaproteobacteria bacterium]
MTQTTTSPTPSSLGQVERHIFLRAVLSGVDVGAAAGALVSMIRDAYFPAGTVIYREGESSDHLYFVVDGVVSLNRPGQEPWIMDPRSVFGALDASLDRPHDRTAVAVDDVHVMLLAVEDWLDILEDHFELARAVIQRNASGLHELCLKLTPTGGFVEPMASLEAEDQEPPPSSAVPDQLDVVDRLLVLSEAPLFKRAGIQPLLMLAPAAEARHLAPGEVLFEQGDRVALLHVVARGIIEIEREDPPIRARFGRGELVAGAPAIANAERAFTARAATDAMVVTLRREDLVDVMEDHFAALRSVLAYLAEERDRMQRLEAELKAGASQQ